jgi:glycosyltransferase involved in cell wall biosynthesis
MGSFNKPIILTFINNYLPGYKAGGMPRSLLNAVSNLKEEIEFRIVTNDRDFGDKKPYDGVILHQWVSVEGAFVYYLSPGSGSLKNIRNLIIDTKHDALYLNSCFDTFTIKVLLIRKFCKMPFKPVIVAPRGVFASASLKLKFLKKITFIYLAKLIGLYKNVTWHASSSFEESDILKTMNIDKHLIHIALDLPTVISENVNPAIIFNTKSADGSLRLIFLSRISRVKNLDFALNILCNVKAKVFFDIYGPLEDFKYWNECQKIIRTLPSNIEVKYSGIVDPNQVVQIFCDYDMFLFPTGGENFGHVIAESLIAGTPVLISDKTPWKNLINKNMGWDVSLDKVNSFSEIIDNYSLLSLKERVEKRTFIKLKIKEYLLEPLTLEANRQLFLKNITKIDRPG